MQKFLSRSITNLLQKAKSLLKCGWTVLKILQQEQKYASDLTECDFGNLGDNRNLGEGVHELRIDYGPGYRIYFGLESNRVVLLLIGGDKSGQAKDIVKAKEFWADYKRRK
jgi:putative addiction module killer protein